MTIFEMFCGLRIVGADDIKFHETSSVPKHITRSMYINGSDAIMRLKGGCSVTELTPYQQVALAYYARFECHGRVTIDQDGTETYFAASEQALMLMWDEENEHVYIAPKYALN